MELPLIFHIAYFLGVNPYSRLISPTFFFCCGLITLSYNIIIGASIIYAMIVARVDVFTVLVVFVRVLMNAYFVFEGCSSVSFQLSIYEEVLSRMENTSDKNTLTIFDTVCLILSCLILSEHVIVKETNAFWNILSVISFSMDVLILLTTMVQFCICCVFINSLYNGLQEDVVNALPCTGAYSFRRLRLRQVDIVDKVTEINRVFSLRLFIYNFTVTLILLEKVNFLVARITEKNYDVAFVFVSVSFYGYLAALWLFSYNPWRSGKKQEEVLSSLLDFPTRDMDVAGFNELVMLAEELNYRPTLFSGGGCFFVGLNSFYSVIGIICSYLMIVGPLAYQQHLKAQY